MKKFLILILITLFSFGALQLLIHKEIITIPHNNSDKNNENIVEKEEAFKPLVEGTKTVNSEDVKNKIALLRSRFSLKGLINNGDTYLEKQQLTLALKSYLAAKEKNPEDKSVLKKIGDTYFEMKKFSIANNNYKSLRGNESFIDDNKLILSYIYTLPLEKNIGVAQSNQNIPASSEDEKTDTDNNKDAINQPVYDKELKSFGISEIDTTFYNTALSCTQNLDSCLETFEGIIKAGNIKDSEEIQDIKQSLQNFSGLQIEEDAQYLKKTYLLSSLFKAELYPIVIIGGKRILEEKPGYLPVIEMIAKGYFELGKYEQAKKYLLEYNKQDSKNPKIHYMLGIVNLKLHDYILSNIYFVKAKKTGFTPISMIYRRLIYNYYLVDNTDKMMIEFANLINTDDDDISEIDYSLGIYYSLIHDKKVQANKWINEALLLYPDDDNFYGYKGWIYKEAGDIVSATEYFEKGFALNTRNPLINLNMGMIEVQNGNMLKAKILFKNTIREDVNGQFGAAAENELAKIKRKQEEKKQEKDEEQTPN